MKTRFTSCSVLMLLASVCAAQQPFLTYGDAPAWSVLHCTMGIGVACNTDHYQYEDTVSMCGSTYAMLPFDGYDTMYVRNEGQRTRFRRTTDCASKEYLMYDFGMSVGDSVYAGLNVPYGGQLDTARFKLLGIDTVMLFDIARRRFHLLFDRCNEFGSISYMDWIEGIGSTTHPFYPLACICDYCESGFRTLCCDSAGVMLYRDSLYNTCDTVLLGVKEISSEQAALHVAAVNGGSAVRLTYPDGFLVGTLTLFDALGRKCASMAVWRDEPVVPIPHESPNICLFKLEDGSGRTWSTKWVRP